MKFPDHGARFPIELDTKHCSPAPADLEKMWTNLDSLTKAIENFPVVSLHILLERFPRTTGCRAKLSLALSGATLVSQQDAAHLHEAFEHCAQNLLADVQEYKARMSNEPERQKLEKGTHHELFPDTDPDPAALEAAVEAQDYTAFRVATLGYEDPLSKRIGRWIERYPKVEARIHKDLKISDLVEEVFLDGFENYPRRPKDIRFGEWLESLIDPAINEIMRDHNGELDNARMVQSARLAELGEA